MSSNKFTGLAVLAVLLMAACRPYEYNGTLLNPPKPIPDFDLETDEGGEFRLADRGEKLLVIFFGYTHCPDICPATLFQLHRTLEMLGNDAEHVRVAMITTDPERDTSAQLDSYLASIDDSFTGLREPDRDQLEQIMATFGVYSEVDPSTVAGDAEYLVTHTSAVIVLDEVGMRLVFSSGMPAEDMAADLQALIDAR